MTILFGHPTGNPNSHHSALAHFESGNLEAFCVAWMPSAKTVQGLRRIALGRRSFARLERRQFAPLELAPTVQGRAGEWRRLALRAFGFGDEGLSYEANDWLMRTMARECHRPRVTAVHAYEDCAAWQFEEAKRLGKACIYDLPIGYYPAWEATQRELARTYSDWLPARGLSASRHVRPLQKLREMELADLVIAPSSFVERTVREFHPEKRIARAPYGVDLDFWRPRTRVEVDRPIRFLYAGQISLRKGIPLLLDAWSRAGLRDASLTLVGTWQLSEIKRSRLPEGVVVLPPCSSEALRELYRESDVFLFPSFFEGFGLVLLEAMACGLPILATEATAAPDLVNDAWGRTYARESIEALVEHLRWFVANRDRLTEMAVAARSRAEEFTWSGYRAAVAGAVKGFV
ncbi:MAG: glycosyltransferase family 4 protein [Thermoanaerobaculia bacterium]